MDFCSLDVCVQHACSSRGVFQKRSYLKTLKEYTVTHEPTDTSPTKTWFKGRNGLWWSGTSKKTKTEKKQTDSYVCAFSFIFVCLLFLFFAYILISKQSRKVNVNTILSRFAYQLCNKCNPLLLLLLPPSSPHLLCFFFLFFCFWTP